MIVSYLNQKLYWTFITLRFRGMLRDSFGEEMECVPVDCGNQLPSIDATCDGPTSYGQAACNFQCNNSERSQLYICTQSGEWFPIGESLDCRHCPSFSSLFSTDSIQTQCENTAIDSECSATCGSGFQGDERQYVCSENGTWEPKDQPLVCTCNFIEKRIFFRVTLKAFIRIRMTV